jgi:hypothetical protein
MSTRPRTRVGILGWGSLVWDPGDLRIVDGQWHLGGPELPIELSRRSDNRGYLTYVVDEPPQAPRSNSIRGPTLTFRSCDSRVP